jgi:hypothetical protein
MPSQASGQRQRPAVMGPRLAPEASHHGAEASTRGQPSCGQGQHQRPASMGPRPAPDELCKKKILSPLRSAVTALHQIALICSPVTSFLPTIPSSGHSSGHRSDLSSGPGPGLGSGSSPGLSSGLRSGPSSCLGSGLGSGCSSELRSSSGSGLKWRKKRPRGGERLCIHSVTDFFDDSLL